jgi:hypothetical protein
VVGAYQSWATFRFKVYFKGKVTLKYLTKKKNSLAYFKAASVTKKKVLKDLTKFLSLLFSSKVKD